MDDTFIIGNMVIGNCKEYLVTHILYCLLFETIIREKTLLTTHLDQTNKVALSK